MIKTISKWSIILIVLLSASLLSPFSVYAYTFGQDSVRALCFRYPLNVNYNLSGNYGELRSNHFHSGIDCRIGGVEGVPVYAAEDGYISKISISPFGYGNCLFITHSSGYTTVYGHLQKFAPNYWNYAREQQYKGQQFDLDLTFAPEQFPVKKGDLIAYAGNSGSSGGPHLHFEIRHNNEPINSLAHNYIVCKDTRAPFIKDVVFVGMYSNNGTFVCDPVKKTKSPVYILPQLSFVAIDAIDFMEGTSAKLAIETYNVYLDNDRIYSLSLGDIPFNKSRYINSLLYYPFRIAKGAAYIKSYVEEGNLLKDRIIYKNSGLINLKDSLEHTVKVEVLDYKHNRSIKSFRVKCGNVLCDNKLLSKDNQIYMDWGLSNINTRQGLELAVPPASLYSSAYITVDTASTRVSQYSPLWKIGSPEIPLQNGAKIAIKTSVPESLASKALVALVSANGRLTSVGGIYKDGYMSVRIGYFGNYTVVIDNKPPKIYANFKNGATIKSGILLFSISDDLSGVKSYSVTIDDKWVLASLDGKTSKLKVLLKQEGVTRGKHNVRVVVMDAKGNSSYIERIFIY